MSLRYQHESLMKTTPTRLFVTHVEYLLRCSKCNYCPREITLLLSSASLFLSFDSFNLTQAAGQHKIEEVRQIAISTPAITRPLQRLFDMSDIEVPSPPFEMNDLHTKALLKLLHCHHSGIQLDYSKLSEGMLRVATAMRCLPIFFRKRFDSSHTVNFFSL